MSLDAALFQKYKEDPWFQENKTAWAIVNDGRQEISSTKPDTHNLQCLLSNMCAYGKDNWRYEPGSKTSVPNTLKGTSDVTDCGSLANIYCAIAKQLGYDAVPRQIKKDGYRIVTKPLATFKGKIGDDGIGGRWCFGNHWVAEYANLCYDPTFKLTGFNFPSKDVVYLGWFAKEVADKNLYCRAYWKADGGVADSKDVFMRSNGEYTFDRSKA